MRIFSSAFSRLVSKKVVISGWCAFKYTAPAPWRAPSWLAYEKASSRSFMTGTTPEDWFSIFLIGAPCSRRLVRLSATPPPRLESCSEELIPQIGRASCRERVFITVGDRSFEEIRRVYMNSAVHVLVADYF